MKRSILLSIVILLVFLITPVAAQVSITGVPFLQIEPDPRAAGMGNAGVAMADNANAVFWNPAGLAFQRGSQVSITHSNWLPNFDVDLFYDYLVGKHHIDGIGTIGGHITFLNLGEQVRTSEDNVELGTFNSFELAAGISYGFQLSENFSMGFGGRFIRSKLADGAVGGQQVNPGTSVGFDMSGLWKSNTFTVLNRDAQINVGLNISNLGPAIQFTDEEQKDPLPTTMRLGYAYTMELDPEGFNTLTISTDVSKIMARLEQNINSRGDTTFTAQGPIEGFFNSFSSIERDIGAGDIVNVSLFEQLMWANGLEYWYNNRFALRAGFFYEAEDNGNRKFGTLGAGIKYNVIGVDFSYLYTLEEDSPLANTIRFGLLVDF